MARIVGMVVLASLVLGCHKEKKPDPVPPPEASAVLAPASVAPSVASAHKREDRHEPAEAGASFAVEVRLAGAPTKTWTKATLDSVPKLTAGNLAKEGEARDTWSLRELARVLVGPKARVVAVAGPDERKTVSRAAWDDPKQVPILHTTRRGTLKFRYADAAGAWGDTEVRDVTRIDVEVRE
jgi:hypothetical protein